MENFHAPAGRTFSIQLQFSSGASFRTESSENFVHRLELSSPWCWWTVRWCFQKLLQLLQLFSRMLQFCFTVKLQNCSVDYHTSPDFISTGGGEEDWVLLSLWTVPLNVFICWHSTDDRIWAQRRQRCHTGVTQVWIMSLQKASTPSDPLSNSGLIILGLRWTTNYLRGSRCLCLVFFMWIYFSKKPPWFLIWSIKMMKY